MQDSKKQTPETPESGTEDTRLQMVLRQIREDAEDKANEYIQETRVPAGGE